MNPRNYVKMNHELAPFPTDPHVIIREDDRVEKLCKHGVGHPIGHLTEVQNWMGVHGCDGCCYKAEFWQGLVK